MQVLTLTQGKCVVQGNKLVGCIAFAYRLVQILEIRLGDNISRQTDGRTGMTLI